MKSCEVVELVRKNGVGKTTLFHLLLALKFSHSGLILYNGISTLDSVSRRKVSFVPDRPALNFDQTLHEMLCFFGALSGVNDLKAKICEVIKEVGLDHLEGVNYSKYKLKTGSKGMLQRALIAQALLVDPEFLILDEPFNGLDFEGQVWLRSLLLHFKSVKKTILFSSHHPEEAKGLADRVLIFSDGRLKEEND